MADVVPPEVRSRMMSGIRGKNTRPEILLRSGLHRLGFRFRIHSKKLPGKPDIVLPKHRAVVLFHGCFWHGHDCPLFRPPSTRSAFWKDKIEGNRKRDARVLSSLRDSGWRVAVVRECAIRGAGKRPWEAVCGDLAAWIRAGQGETLEIAAMVPKAVPG